MASISILNRMGATWFGLALMLGACGGAKTPETTQSTAAAAKQYQMRGEIMGLDAGGHVATIKHEEIKGFMGAMTMGYPVKDAAEFSKLTVGEPITATVYVNGDEMWIGNIQKASGGR
jgi:Cu/Ag efflux protein CusF